MPASAVSLTLKLDKITPSLTALASDTLKQRLLDAAGTVIGSLAQRAFDEPGLRPRAWARRQDSLPHALLIKETDLRQSIHHQVSGDSVRVGSPKEYAPVQQLGSRSAKGRGGGIPARPFFPVLAGQLTGVATAELDEVLAMLIGKAAEQ